MNEVSIRQANPNDLEAVTSLRWLWIVDENKQEAALSREEFIRFFVEWADTHADSHECFVALDTAEVIGMAWLCIVNRVPSPRSPERISADLQSVFVVPDERNTGVGSLLIEAVVAAASHRGAERLTVHSSERPVPAYQRAGFTLSPRLLDMDVADQR